MYADLVDMINLRPHKIRKTDQQFLRRQQFKYVKFKLYINLSDVFYRSTPRCMHLIQSTEFDLLTITQYSAIERRWKVSVYLFTQRHMSIMKSHHDTYLRGVYNV